MAKDVDVAFFLCRPRCFHNLTKFPSLHTNQVAMDSYNTKEMMDFTVWWKKFSVDTSLPPCFCTNKSFFCVFHMK